MLTRTKHLIIVGSCNPLTTEENFNFQACRRPQLNYNTQAVPPFFYHYQIMVRSTRLLASKQSFDSGQCTWYIAFVYGHE
jgi:hypothetical protein